jgi:hypothetical protein
VKNKGVIVAVVIFSKNNSFKYVLLYMNNIIRRNFSMRKAIISPVIAQRRETLSQRQKSLSTLANANSAVGHTVGAFSGITIGVNITKAMERNGINSGVSIAAGIVSAIAITAAVSLATESVSNSIRKKAGVSSPLAIPCFETQNNYRTLLDSLEEYDDYEEDTDEYPEEYSEEYSDEDNEGDS